MRRRRRREPRSASLPLPLALADRELGVRRLCVSSVPRRRQSLQCVLREEEGGALLGFSNDGNFLVYAFWQPWGYEVQWKRVDAAAFECRSESAKPLEVVFTLRVRNEEWRYEVITPLSVWQSVDHALVLAIASDASGRDVTRLCRLAVAPSPAFDGGFASSVTSLSFRFNRHAASQDLEAWQLLQLVRGGQTPANVYHLLVNVGSVVHVLVLHASRSRADLQPQPEQQDDEKPRGLGITHFVQNAWYYSPTFATSVEKTTLHRRYVAGRDRWTVGVECLCEQIFDAERFLGPFLDTFRPLRHFNLVDYDLRLVRARTAEKTVFLTYVLAMAPSPLLLQRDEGLESRGASRRQQLRVALFLSLELFTGEHHLIRVLKVPEKRDLRQLSQEVAQRFRRDLDAHLPSEDVPSTWNNDAVVSEQTLTELHNPLFPLSIGID